MLSSQQLNAIADRINASVDLPFLNEEAEKQLIQMALGKLGGLLAGVLTKDQQAAISDPNKGLGLDAQGSSQLTNSLATQLAGKLDMGMLNSALSQGVAKTIAQTLVGAMEKGKKLG